MDTVIAPGQRWRTKQPEGSNWRVVAMSRSNWRVVSISPDGLISLTGPGPCRMMKYIAADDLEQDFELVPDDEKE